MRVDEHFSVDKQIKCLIRLNSVIKPCKTSNDTESNKKAELSQR